MEHGVRKLLRFSLYGLLMAYLLACTPDAHDAVEQVLNQRTQAMQEKNIAHYADLIADDYFSRGQDKQHIVADVQHLFQTFEKIEMKTSNRTVRILSNDHAECEQSYTLRVFSDGQWRDITHREQLMLQRQGGSWKVIAGL